MKNKIKFAIGLFAVALMVSSCNEDEIGSTVTNFPVFTLAGDDPYFVELGTPFVDPGAIATIDDAEVPFETQFVGMYQGNVFTALDTNVADVYNLNYSATNQDGFNASATRQVIVAKTGDLVNSIEGVYRSTVFRNGVQGAPASAYTDIEYILIWKNADGSYQISDSFGGWYLFARAIADSETPGGIIVANNIATNDFSFPGTQTNTYFGGTSEITGMTVDPVARTIDVTTTWTTVAPPVTNYTFTFTLEQVTF